MIHGDERLGGLCAKATHPNTQIHFRLISTTLLLNHGDDDLKNVPETVRVIFISKDGSKIFKVYYVISKSPCLQSGY